MPIDFSVVKKYSYIAYLKHIFIINEKFAYAFINIYYQNSLKYNQGILDS